MVNPWPKFEEDYKVGDAAEGIVKNITDYALFISIKDTELVGMIHKNDLSWAENEIELTKYKKNQSLKFKILEINRKKEKIRLGLKQLTKDPFDFFMNKNILILDIGRFHGFIGKCRKYDSFKFTIF